MSTTTRTDDGKGGFVEVTTAQQSSIEISMNAKKDISWSCKVYNDDPVKAAEILKDFLKIAEGVRNAAVEVK